MPRKAKDENVIEEKKNTKKASTKAKTATKKVTSKASTTKKKVATKKDDTSSSKKKVAVKTKTTKTKVASKKASFKKDDASSSKKKVTAKAKTTKAKVTSKKDASSSKKKVTAKAKTTKTKVTTKKASSKKAVSKATKTKKVSTRKTSTKISTKTKKPEIIEYYDLPYKYNKTVVKLLAQTPTTLFVYWEISDRDKEDFIKTYGEYFFNNTKPVLIIHNHTFNYSFEIDINDFANCWYIHVKDANSDYEIELGRRGINQYIDIPNNYLFISNSNQIESPNDHILFEKLPNKVLFKNVKTNQIIEKAIFYYLAKIKSTYNVKDFYKTMYKDEDFDFDKLTLKNPSSSSSSPSY